MGLAEVVPGVSGGTIALIVGIYRTIIEQAAHLVSALRLLIRPPEGQSRWRSFWAEFMAAKWSVLLPVAIGMFSAILIGASVIEPMLEDYPIQSRALFSGLVLAGIIVPFKMVTDTRPGAWRLQDAGLAVLAAAGAFILTGLPPGSISNPSIPVIMLAAALAVCALVLPGVSGSFLLLSIGLYEATLAAVNDRDFGYLLPFIFGAIIGLGTFVVVLQWLFEHKARPTLVILTGLMAGSLRALWPWQTEDRGLLAPGENIGSALLLFAIGFGIVALLLGLEQHFRHGLTDEHVEAQSGDATEPQQ